MKTRIITHKQIQQFEMFLKNEERSRATIEKYIRDIKHFYAFAASKSIGKQCVMEYKNTLRDSYTVTSANSMIAALNVFFRFSGWHDLCVKQFKV
ncbi:MAG: site-specific integrase, partial [Clostridia bacterium]|nr:site-specific integrase [Clostridia bacterium]